MDKLNSRVKISKTGRPYVEPIDLFKGVLKRIDPQSDQAEHQRLEKAVVEAAKAFTLHKASIKDVCGAVENLLQFEKDHGLEFKEGQK